jgi:hypothetical protein
VFYGNGAEHATLSNYCRIRWVFEMQ